MKFRYIENEKGKPIRLLHGAVAVTYKNNTRIKKPILCIEAGSWQEACAKINGEETLPPEKTAIEQLNDAIYDCHFRRLVAKCILCRFDFYDRLMMELGHRNMFVSNYSSNNPPEVFGVRLARTPDIAGNVNKFEVIT